MRPARHRPATRPRPRGFTLIELAIVVLIIGLLLAFVLAASASAVESARVRATQSLITKLSVGLEERLEAVLATQPPVNGAHRFLAAINTPAYPAPAPYGPGVNANLPWGLESDQRAEVIARLDQIRAEFPDVFYIVPRVLSGGSKGKYPIRFAGLSYPLPLTDPDPSDSDLFTGPSAGMFLPLGNTVGPISGTQTYFPDRAFQPGNTYGNVGPGGYLPGITGTTGTGVNGASYGAAAGLYKLIGYTPRGYDGLDNGNDSTSTFAYVDDHNEGVTDPNGTNNAEADAKVNTFLANHTHKTARAEMLYALLVEGQGPLGSVFNAEDFLDSEIKDTDNDGVPEFVDGWGEPLQFYFRPFAHRSDIQKGNSVYGAFEARERLPLDPNGQLTSLSWWCNNSAADQMSTKCLAVQNYFGPLTDPFWQSGVAPQPTAWDRSGSSPRRAFSTKFLIVSGGPDREVGIPRLSDFDVKNTSLYDSYGLARVMNGAVAANGTLTAGEGWALLLDPANLPAWAASNPDYSGLELGRELDDISNQAIQNQAGGFQ